MAILVLSQEEVEQLLDMEGCIEAMADALAALARGEVQQPLRFVVRPAGEPSLMGLMPAHRAGRSPLSLAAASRRSTKKDEAATVVVSSSRMTGGRPPIAFT